MDLYDVIKEAAMVAFRASKPCDTYVGKVESLKPLKVSISQKLVLDADFLYVTTTAKEHMKKGSKVIMVRKSGGQMYTVIDTIE